MLKIKKNDEIIVITGKDKGVIGVVTKVVSRNKLLVEGVNIAKKHVKPNPQSGIEGGIVNKEMLLMYQMLLFIMQKVKKQIELDFVLIKIIIKKDFLNQIIN